jgi:hypothetical protein
MGSYKDAVSRTQANLSLGEIRLRKNRRTKERNAARKAAFIEGVRPHWDIRKNP